MSKTVVIVGGGFCGTLAAVHLMRAQLQFALRIILIDPDEVGRGVAYGTRDRNHLLNVPVGGMSAFAHDPDNFLHFAQSRNKDVVASDFLARSFYGDYLQALLGEALLKKPQQWEFSLIRDMVVDIEEAADIATISLASGKIIHADRVLLATGNGNPSDPIAAANFFVATQRYIRDPWASQGLDAITNRQPVLLIGSGLTAVDVALSLRARNFTQPIYALSRRGLTPLAHRGLNREAPALKIPNALLLAKSLTAAATLHSLREIAATAVYEGSNWRGIFATLRPHIPELWREKFSEMERRRFLRHCQTYWDVHRHRLAPSVAASLQDLLLAKQLTINAGRILNFQEIQSGIEVKWRARGKQYTQSLKVGTVINCTGPCNDLRQSSNPLLQALLRRGVIQQDSLRLGIQIEDNYQPITGDGQSAERLYYAGPLLKAKYWEATAVPELRSHVERAVSQLVSSLRDSL